MSRRILSTLVAALMIFSVLPATAAFAQANATARLTNNQVVHPGNHTYNIEVKNTEPQLIGRTINAVTIQLPTAAANIYFNGKPPAAGNFTNVSAKQGGFTSIVTYRGGSIAPQATQTFSIPTTVKRPYRSDLTGDWHVQVSSNDMTSATTVGATDGGTLTSAVEALEILPNTLRPVGPTNADNSKGVTDGSGTAGQTVTYSFDVKNYAQEALNVTGSLTANKTEEKPGAGVTQSIAGSDGTATFNVPVTLGAATTQRDTIFTANAVAPNADALTKNDTFTVQVPVDLAFTDLRPTRVKSGAGSAREFTVTAAKTGGPGFDLNSSALEFGSNSAGLKNPPVRFNGGTRTASLAYQIAEITGADGDLAARIVNAGQDDNLLDYSLVRGAGLITIDNIVPTFDVKLPTLGNNGNDADGDELIAATDRTRITVNGKAFGTDLVGNTLKVVLQPDAGEPIPVSVSQTQESDGIRFTGSVSGSNVEWVDTATRFTVVAQIQDEATNLGSGESGFTVIDQVAPVFDPDEDAHVVTTPTTIRLEFDDQTGLRGACDPNSWTIDGRPNQVAHVQTSAGINCSEDDDAASALSTDGVRVLVLKSSLGPDDLPEVGYTVPLDNHGAARAAGVYLAKDGAQNDAVSQAVQTITEIVPPAPNVTDPMRKDHQTGEREDAYEDVEEGRFYTNVGGADAIEATVGGVRSGYKIQVMDGNTVLATYDGADRPATSPLATEWSQEILIPLGEAEGVYTRGVRLVSTAEKASVQTILRFVVDTSLPTIGQSTLSGPGEAFGYFNEKIVSGQNNKQDWFATWTLVSEGETREVNTEVDEVQIPEGENLTARRILFSGIDENTFQRLDYMLHSPSSLRYEDRAGNYMLDTLVLESL